ncbi:DUF4157 domain-containing protein [Frankia sp. Cj5]|uniref:eCIS core domain-containing protein n=1 Tax=Frankia sp. Cj5 TaxID=2880978 RepID=UPI001EF50C65|nr:DUF4157 domain-containing protein [Frankia sp. Cj5]
MEHDSVDGPLAAGTVRRNEPAKPPEARPANEIMPFAAGVPSAAGNAAFSQLVHDIRTVSASRGTQTPATAGSAALSRSALFRNALRSQGAGPLDPETADAIQARRGAGSPLSEPVRAEMEGHLGVDLSAVRVHTDGTAATLNRAVQAEAFTTGTDIFFSPGRFDPSSPAGRGLLAHELTHVVQQSAGAGGPGGTVSHPDDPAEREAAAVGAQVARQAAPTPDEDEEPPATT